MGLLSILFSKKKVAPTPQTDPTATLAQTIYNRLMEKTGKEILSLRITDETAGLLESKVGGAYYVPLGSEAPTNQSGKPLYLLAQLNFSELPPLADFPKQGLLQFFIDGYDSIYGLNFDAPANQDNWCIRYLPTLPSEVSEDQICTVPWSEDTMLPLMREDALRIEAVLAKQAMTSSDWQISDTLKACCRDLLPEEFQSVYDLEDDLFDAWNELCEGFSCQVGGYPIFTQYDPREDVEGAPDLLLFQLDSGEHVMWGDSGVANFFISREDLMNLDFSHVWYNWDCY